MNDNNLYTYIKIKNSLNNINSYLDYLINENTNLNYDIFLSNLIKNNNINDKFSNNLLNKNNSTLTLSNENFIKVLDHKKEKNKYIISIIDDYLLKNCSHNIFEDHIEQGVEKDMLKIKYCENCYLSF